MTTTRGWRQPLVRLLGVGAFAALGLVAVRAAIGRLDAVRVEGDSMRPQLEPGDLVIVESWTLARRPPAIGDVVLAADPRAPSREMVKRVASVDTERGTVRLLGDNADVSTDSRSFGDVPLATVRWRVLVRYWPPRRGLS